MITDEIIQQMNLLKKSYGVKRSNALTPYEREHKEAQDTYNEVKKLCEALPYKFSVKEARSVLKTPLTGTYRKLKLMEVCGFIKQINTSPITYIKSSTTEGKEGETHE